jgi:hypothetical protein
MQKKSIEQKKFKKNHPLFVGLQYFPMRCSSITVTPFVMNLNETHSDRPVNFQPRICNGHGTFGHSTGSTSVAVLSPGTPASLASSSRTSPRSHAGVHDSSQYISPCRCPRRSRRRVHCLLIHRARCVPWRWHDP